MNSLGDELTSFLGGSMIGQPHLAGWNVLFFFQNTQTGRRH